MEYVDELDSVPEPDHVELIMDGFIDTVSGSEGFTKAQHYLEAVLFTNGIISRRDIGGTEGILSKIGDGAKAAVEYIKKMFRAIWDFFFKKEKKAIDEDCKKELLSTEDKLKKMRETVTEAEIDEVLKKASAGVDRLKEGPEKTKLKEKVKEAQDSKDNKHKVQVGNMVLPEIFEAHRLNETLMGAYADKFKTSIKKLEEMRDQQKATGSSSELSGEIQIVLNGLGGLPEVVGKIKDLASADAYINKARRCREAMMNNLTTIENEESRYKAMITEVENTKGKDATAALKESLVTITAIIAQAKDIIKWMMEISKVIGKACVVVI